MSVTIGGAKKFRQWRIKQVKKVIPKHAALIHQKAHIQLSDSLVFATPVGNPSLWQSPPPAGYAGGRARGGWQSSVHAPKLSETGTLDRNGSNTAQAGQSISRSIGFAIKSFITNNVPYIIRLNEGWSKQIPADFIDRAFDRVEAQFR